MGICLCVYVCVRSTLRLGVCQACLTYALHHYMHARARIFEYIQQLHDLEHVHMFAYIHEYASRSVPKMLNVCTSSIYACTHVHLHMFKPHDLEHVHVSAYILACLPCLHVHVRRDFGCKAYRLQGSMHLCIENGHIKSFTCAHVYAHECRVGRALSSSMKAARSQAQNHPHVCMCAHVHVHAYVCFYLCTCVSVYVYYLICVALYVCMHVYTYV